jgi:ketosteroid isomerase-like protein
MEVAMSDRSQIEKLLTEAYEARIRGDVDAVCACFGENPTFRMAGSREASPIVVQCTDTQSFRKLMSGFIKTFELSELQILLMLIDGSRAAVHWRASLRRTVSGDEVVTEFMDLLTIRDGKIQTMTEFSDTALAAQLMVGDIAWVDRATA